MNTTVATTDYYDLDPTHWSPVEVAMPEGYYRVWAGTIKPGDLYLNLVLLRDGIVSWEPLDPEYELRRAKAIRCRESARTIECIIRHGRLVEEACERCHCQRRHRKWRYCDRCADIIRQELAERSEV